MTLLAGTCTIDDDGAVSGTGLAKALADAVMAPPPDGPVTTNKMLERWTNLMAAAIVEHLVANAAITVVVGPSTAGLQRTPDPNNANTPTLAPAGDVELAGSLA